MFIINAAKHILSFGVSVGAGATVKYLAAAITPVESIKPLTRIALKISTVVIGAAVGELASNFMEKTIDDSLSVVKGLKQVFKKTQKSSVMIGDQGVLVYVSGPESAVSVLLGLQKLIESYDRATLGDLLYLLSLEEPSDADLQGWTSLPDAKIIRDEETNEYKVLLPELIEFTDITK